VFSDLNSSLLRSKGALRSAPQRKRCAEGSGLRARLTVHQRDIAILSYSSNSSCGSLSLWFFVRSASLCVRAATRSTNLYPAGFNPFQNPSGALRGRGLQWGWTFLLAASFSPSPVAGHTPLDLIASVIGICLRSSPLRTHPRRHHAISRYARAPPAAARQRHYGDAADAAFVVRTRFRNQTAQSLSG